LKYGCEEKVYAELEEIVPPHCLFFTNTSGLSITGDGFVTKSRIKSSERTFFNPVPVMNFWIIIVVIRLPTKHWKPPRRGQKNRQEVIVVKEAPAFVVNRILCLMHQRSFLYIG